jgi:single-stranded DNA-specific DHH superfamily exonuclease
LQQVVQVPLQFFGVAADAGGAGDDAHALALRAGPWFRAVPALFALDAARNATAARVVGHQHQVAAGQRDEGGQGGALVAALFLLDLDDQFLAFAQRFLDARLATSTPSLKKAREISLNGRKPWRSSP